MKRTMSRRAFWGALIGRANHNQPEMSPVSESACTTMPISSLQADATAKTHAPVLASGVASATCRIDHARKASAQELALLHDFPPAMLALEARKYGLDPEADRESLAKLLTKALSPVG